MSALLRLLRTRNLPILEQLRIEEALLRSSPDNWLIINDGASKPAIVLGISGKAEEHVDLLAASAAGVPLIRRFSGGGTVVVDRNTIFTALIFNRNSLPDVKPFPRNIMDFTGEVFGDILSVLPRSPLRVPNSSATALTSADQAQLEVQENDYVVAGRKVAGNAQAIVKDRWLHHTSWLWDFSRARMALLHEPERRPQYRGARRHGTFLAPLVSLGVSRTALLEGFEDAFAARGFDVQPADLESVRPFLEKDYLRGIKLLDPVSGQPMMTVGGTSE